MVISKLYGKFSCEYIATRPKKVRNNPFIVQVVKYLIFKFLCFSVF